MKIVVNWHGREKPHEFEFSGESEDGLRLEIGARSVEGGPKSAPSPKEQTAMAMAACSGIDIVSFLQKMRQPLRALSIACDLTQTDEQPKVFETCQIVYELEGEGLDAKRAAHAVGLSFHKYCGVSAMIRRSGCEIFPLLRVNGVAVEIDHHIEKGKSLGDKLNVAILITGNEVLSGKTRDTNGFFLSRALEDLGHAVSASLTVGDDEKTLKGALEFLSRKADVILMTGGLGPTSDDLTANVVASFTQQELAFNDAAWRVCTEMFAKLGRKDIPESNKKQALLPALCQVLDNKMGTAAGFVSSTFVEGRKVDVVCMPGVPYEMEAMFESGVKPLLGNAASQTLKYAWQVFMLGESKLQSAVREIENDLKVKFPNAVVSYQAHSCYVTYSCSLTTADNTAREGFAAYVQKSFEPALYGLVGDKILYAAGKNLLAALSAELKAKAVTVSFAESCTGGLLSKELATVPGTSSYFIGSAVVYANAAKTTMLGVNENTLQSFGAVSEETACEMASGIRAKLKTDLSLSITGVAGPGGGTERHPVGQVSFAVAIALARIKDSLGLEQRLGLFGWRRAESDAAVELRFVSTQNFGATRKREAIQTRASDFAQASLYVCLAYLK